jgi:hypothetical protein
VQSTAVLPLDFTWTAPDTCPTQAAVVEQLSRAVEAGGKDLPPLTARATVSRDGATWQLVLVTEMDGRRGTRVLEADSCEGLARAATLVLALTLGEGLARRQAEAEAAAAAPPPAPVAPPPPAKSAPPPPALRRPLVLLWASAALGTDALGVLGPGVLVGAAFQPNLLQLGVRLEATFPRSSELEGSEGEVQSFGFTGELSACVAPTLTSVQLSLCGNGGATWLEVRGQGTASDRSANIPLYGIGPSLGARWLLGSAAFVSLEAASRFFVKRPQLLVDGAPERRRVESATLNAALGGGVRW